MTHEEKQAALAAIEGLTFGDALLFFNNKATDREKDIAELAEWRDETFERDDHIISEGDDNGAYVLGWRWVSFAGTEFDKGNDDEDEDDEDDEDEACLGCGAVPGTPEYGTVGDGFDGYCGSCADKREESGEVEIG
jgi:hypothetical protein